jgi:hypothetical protein
MPRHYPKYYIFFHFHFDYYHRCVTTLTRGIWMSFFDTEEAHAVMLAYAANGGFVD